MKKITIAVIAFAMMITFGWSNVHAAPIPQAPLIECQSTHWVAKTNSGWQDNGWSKMLAQVDELRDVNNNAYCGEIRGHTSWQWDVTGICQYYFSKIWAGVSPTYTLLQTVRSSYNCGTNGTILTSGFVENDDGINRTYAEAEMCPTTDPNGQYCIYASSPSVIIS